MNTKQELTIPFDKANVRTLLIFTPIFLGMVTVLFFLTTNQLHSDSGEHGKAKLAELFLKMEQTAILETFGAEHVLPGPGAVGAGLAARQQNKRDNVVRLVTIGMCSYAAKECEGRFPSPHNELLNREDLSCFVINGIIRTTTLHSHKPSASLQGSIALEVFSQYVGTKTVDLTVWGINGFTNWWADRNIINPNSNMVIALKIVATGGVLWYVQKNVQIN